MITSVGTIETYQIIGLPDLIRGLLQSALRCVDPPVTVIDVFLHVSHVVKVESPFSLVGCRSCLILGLQSFAMYFWAGSEVLFRVGEEIVRAGSCQVRSADIG